MGARESLLKRQKGLGDYQAFHSEWLASDSEFGSKRQVVEMLFDGLAASLCRARFSVYSKNVNFYEFNQCLARSRRIVTGLTLTLESVSPKSDISEQLAGIYRYWLSELGSIRPNAGQVERLDALIAMVSELRQAWAST